MSGEQRAVDIFVAAFCDNGHSPGGWGAVLRYGEHARELQGSDLASAAPTRLLSTAAAAAFSALTRPVRVRLHADEAVLVPATISPSRIDWIGPPEGRDGARAVQLARESLATANQTLEARCLHDLIVRQCWQCRPATTTRPDRVKVTSGDLVFHLDDGCAALHDGWRKLERRGGIRSELTSVPIADALAKGFGACEVCCRGLKL